MRLTYGHSCPLCSVQSEILIYRPIDKKFAMYLEGELTDQIQRSIRRWRSKRATTRFNKIVSRKLKALLREMEESKLEGKYSANIHSKHLGALKETQATSQLIGFPLNTTFTEVDAILRAVKNTDIHNMIERDVQYALAVLVLPYPNKVFSIWIYPAAIINVR